MQWAQNNQAVIVMGVVAFLLLLSTMAAHVRINRMDRDMMTTEDSISRLRDDVREKQVKTHRRIDQAFGWTTKVSRRADRIERRVGRLKCDMKAMAAPIAAHAATDDDPDDEMVDQMAAIAAIQDLFQPLSPRSAKLAPPDDDGDENFGWPGPIPASPTAAVK